MQHEEGLFDGAADLKLYYQRWLPDGLPKAIVVLVHGFSDHCGRYSNVVDVFVEQGLGVYSYDLRGHGQSPGKPGYIDSFNDYRQDTHQFINFVRSEHPDLPLFLFGQSMGGLIALDQALHYPDGLSGVIASAPHLGSAPVSPVKLMAAKLFSRVWPSLGMSAGLDEAGLARDETVAQAYLDDPLVHGKGTPRLATELDATIEETQTNAQRLEPALLIYHGSDDRLTNPEDSKRFYDNVQNENKRLVIYEGGYHENHNDIHGERVVMDVVQWIEEQLLIGAREQTQQDG